MIGGPPEKLRVATTSLAGCFGCHMSLLDIDERLFDLLERIELDRSPLTDIKDLGRCDVGIVEGGVCNAENVLVLREFRAQCRTLVAIGACAVNGGLPAQRNHLDLGLCLQEVYKTEPGLLDVAFLVEQQRHLPVALDTGQGIDGHAAQALPGGGLQGIAASHNGSVHGRAAACVRRRGR